MADWPSNQRLLKAIWVAVRWNGFSKERENDQLFWILMKLKRRQTEWFFSVNCDNWIDNLTQICFRRQVSKAWMKCLNICTYILDLWIEHTFYHHYNLVACDVVEARCGWMHLGTYFSTQSQARRILALFSNFFSNFGPYITNVCL